MTEKIGLIKNPLTIIAIFAGIAEVSGTVVLPFVAQVNQVLFIYFLISFPSVLVVLFFITLNFNNKVLYAPSDYKDETNYIRINKYDISQQKTIEVKIPKEISIDQTTVQLTEKINLLNNQALKLESSLLDKSESLNDHPFIETVGYEFLVSNFENVTLFLEHMKKFDMEFEIYHPPQNGAEISSFREHRAIWLGKKVSLKLAQLIIKQAKTFYPHLKYIKISDTGYDAKNVYIGGSTQSATNNFNRKPLANSDFDELQNFTDLESFQTFINKFFE